MSEVLVKNIYNMYDASTLVVWVCCHVVFPEIFEKLGLKLS